MTAHGTTRAISHGTPRGLRAVLSACLLGQLLLLPLWAAEEAEREETMISAIMGVSKELPFCSPGHWWPVFVTVHNAGPDFAGEVVISPDRSKLKGRQLPFATRCRRKVTLPKGTTKRIPIPVFFPWHVPAWQVEVVSDRGRSLLGAPLPVLAATPATESIVLVVAERRGARHFLRQQPSKWANEKCVRGRQVIFAKPSLLPHNWLLLSGYDCIVVDNIPAGFLSEEQLSALAEYCLGGGCLVLAAGPNALWIKRSPLAKILPAKPLAIANRDVGRELARQFGLKVAETRPMATAVVDKVDGRVLASCQGSPIVVRAHRGRGVVTFLAFSLSSPAAESWENKTALGRVLMQPKEISAFDSIVHEVKPGSRWALAEKSNPRAEMLAFAESRPLAKFPSHRRVVLFLAVYLAVLCPLTYLVFRKAQRLELAWAVCPIWALGFAAVPYVAEVGKRGTEASLSEARVIETACGQTTGLATSWFVAYSPEAADYHVRFGSGKPLVTDFHASGGQMSRLGRLHLDVAFGATTSVPGLSVLRQSVRSFGAFETVNLGEGIQVSFGRGQDPKIHIASKLGFDLDRVWFFTPRQSQAAAVGTVPSHGSLTIQPQWVSRDAGISGLISSGSDADLQRKLLDLTLAGLRRSTRPARGRLIGWLDRGADLIVNGKTAAVAGVTLVVVHVPLTASLMEPPLAVP